MSGQVCVYCVCVYARARLLSICFYQPAFSHRIFVCECVCLPACIFTLPPKGHISGARWLCARTVYAPYGRVAAFHLLRHTGPRDHRIRWRIACTRRSVCLTHAGSRERARKKKHNVLNGMTDLARAHTQTMCVRA